MTHSERYVRIALWVLACVITHNAYAYQLATIDTSGDPKGDTGYNPTWDSVQDRLILYRDISAPGIPAIRIFDAAGKSVPAFPLRDLQGAQHISIWSAAATPDGGAVFSAVVVYGPKGTKGAPVKGLLLTYDASGKLRKVWDTSPYHHHHLAVDRDGNVFGLGERNDKGTTEPYSLLVKYSPQGEVLNEFLSSEPFSQGDGVVEASPAGNTQMFLKGDELVLWLAPVQEVYRFSLDGTLRSRVSLAPALQRIAKSAARERAQVLAFGIDQSGEFVAQANLWPNMQEQSAKSVRLVMVRFAPNGEQERFDYDLPRSQTVLGVAADGHLVFQDAKGNVSKQ